MADEHGSERWRPVVGYEGLYEVSDLGRVRSLPRVEHWTRGFMRRRGGRVLAQILDSKGYPKVNLSLGGKVTQLAVHRLVLLAFTGPQPDDTEACHWNGVPTDNRVANLRWDTRSANAADAIRHGTFGALRRNRK